jgi:hypothetical protein
MTDPAPRIFFFIMAHHEPAQLSKLVSALRNELDHICIHVDRKTDITPFRKLVKESSNVNFLHERIKVNWGAFSQVKAVLAGMKQFIKSGADYFINLSGMDYPVQRMPALRDFLAAGNKKSYLSATDVATGWRAALTRTEKYYFPDLFEDLKRWFGFRGIFDKIEAAVTHFQSVVRRKPLKGYRLFAGSSWFMLHRNAVHQILATTQADRRLIRYFIKTRCPDEMYFHTILYNSGISSTLADRNYRFDRIPPGGSNAAVLGFADLDAIRNSGAFFARKFLSPVSDSLITALGLTTD